MTRIPSAAASPFFESVPIRERRKGKVWPQYAAAVALTERITAAIWSSTANPLFDAFSRQMMLDNLLRGGFPEFLGDPKTPKTYHTFSRIHGDLERDYNDFVIDPTYFSQGPGNFHSFSRSRIARFSDRTAIG